MNAYDLITKWLIETEVEFNKAKKEGNYWRVDGLYRLYKLLEVLRKNHF